MCDIKKHKEHEIGSSIAALVRKHVDTIEKGKPFFIQDFGYLNNSNIVRKTLLRMIEEERIVRIDIGIYMRPQRTDYGILYPPISVIATAIAQRDKAQILPTGSVALNMLGLSTQVPMTAVYLTNGSARKIKIRNRYIVFKKSAQKNFASKGTLLPLIVSSFKELGEKEITESVLSKVATLIQLAADDEKATMRDDLLLAPQWIRKIIEPIIPVR